MNTDNLIIALEKYIQAEMYQHHGYFDFMGDPMRRKRNNQLSDLIVEAVLKGLYCKVKS